MDILETIQYNKHFLYMFDVSYANSLNIGKMLHQKNTFVL